MNDGQAGPVDEDLVRELMSRLYKGRWRPPSRCECGTGKIRYPSEGRALAAAGLAGEDLGIPFRVYKCPGSSAWHKASRGFAPESLRSRARIMAWHLDLRGAMTRDALLAGLGIGPYPDDRGMRRRYRNVILTLDIFAALGLIAPDDPRRGYISVTDRDGLRRVMVTGLQDYVRARGISWRRA